MDEKEKAENNLDHARLRLRGLLEAVAPSYGNDLLCGLEDLIEAKIALGRVPAPPAVFKPYRPKAERELGN